MSKMAVHEGTVYLADQVADDARQDIAGQTPPCATVQAALAKPERKIELVATAAT